MRARVTNAERTSTGVTTGFERPAAPAAPPAIEGFDRESNAVDTLQTIKRGFNAISGGGSNVNSGGLSSSVSVAIDLEPPHAERTSTKITTGFAGPAAPPAIERFDRESSAVDTLQTINRGFNAISGGGSNVNSGGRSLSASVIIDLEPPHAERTSTKITTGFAGPAAPPAIDG